MTATAPAAISASFGRAAARYRAHARVQQAMADWLAEWLPAPGLRTGSALELGAGPGIFTDRLLPWTGPLLATDLSAEMCAVGERRLPQVEWRVAAAEHPPAGPWDWVLTSSMLQWVSDPTRALAACHAALAPGGRCLGGLFIAPTIPEWTALTGAASPLQWRTAGYWEDSLRGAGFHLVRTESRSIGFEFSSALEFVRSLHAVGAAPTRRLPPGKLRRLLAQYDQRHRSPNGVFTSWTFFRFEATR